MKARMKHFGFSIARRYANNPILVPQGSKWEARAVFNPTAWTDGKRVYLLYRAEGPSGFPDREFCSRIGLAVSEDGINFIRNEYPVLQPTEPYEIPGGCEDPRLVRIGDVFFLTYTAYDGKTARLAMAKSADLMHWEKCGLLLPDHQWESFFPFEQFCSLFPRGWSKSGAILSERVNGLYWMFFGDTHIFAATSNNLLEWDVIAQPVISPRPGYFDSRLVEPGPPPVLLSDGIWLGYNSADNDLRYSFGQCLIDSKNPQSVIYRSNSPILHPSTIDEIDGQVPSVVFGEGLVLFKGVWFLYYGMADSKIGVAFLNRFTT